MPHLSHIHSCIVLQAVVQTFTLPGLLPAQITISGATADNPGPSAHATQRVLDPRSAHRGCERNSDSLTTYPLGEAPYFDYKGKMYMSPVF